MNCGVCGNCVNCETLDLWSLENISGKYKHLVWSDFQIQNQEQFYLQRRQTPRLSIQIQGTWVEPKVRQMKFCGMRTVIGAESGIILDQLFSVILCNEVTLYQGGEISNSIISRKLGYCQQAYYRIEFVSTAGMYLYLVLIDFQVADKIIT